MDSEFRSRLAPELLRGKVTHSLDRMFILPVDRDILRRMVSSNPGEVVALNAHRRISLPEGDDVGLARMYVARAKLDDRVADFGFRGTLKTKSARRAASSLDNFLSGVNETVKLDLDIEQAGLDESQLAVMRMMECGLLLECHKRARSIDAEMAKSGVGRPEMMENRLFGFLSPITMSILGNKLIDFLEGESNTKNALEWFNVSVSSLAVVNYKDYSAFHSQLDYGVDNVGTKLAIRSAKKAAMFVVLANTMSDHVLDSYARAPNEFIRESAKNSKLIIQKARGYRDTLYDLLFKPDDPVFRALVSIALPCLEYAKNLEPSPSLEFLQYLGIDSVARLIEAFHRVEDLQRHRADDFYNYLYRQLEEVVETYDLNVLTHDKADKLLSEVALTSNEAGNLLAKINSVLGVRYSDVYVVDADTADFVSENVDVEIRINRSKPNQITLTLRSGESETPLVVYIDAKGNQVSTNALLPQNESGSYSHIFRLMAGQVLDVVYSQLVLEKQKPKGIRQDFTPRLVKKGIIEYEARRQEKGYHPPRRLTPIEEVLAQSPKEVKLPEKKTIVLEALLVQAKSIEKKFGEGSLEHFQHIVENFNLSNVGNIKSLTGKFRGKDLWVLRAHDPQGVRVRILLTLSESSTKDNAVFEVLRVMKRKEDYRDVE
jgi:hypothetical protein